MTALTGSEVAMIAPDAPVSDRHDECRRLRRQARALRARSLSLTGQGEQLVQLFAQQAAAAPALHASPPTHQPSRTSGRHPT